MKVCGFIVPFVPELMFQTGPEVHGDGSQLNLHLCHPFSVLQMDGNGNNQMKTAVTIGLEICDVVLFLKQNDIVLLQNEEFFQKMAETFGCGIRIGCCFIFNPS